MSTRPRTKLRSDRDNASVASPELTVRSRRVKDLARLAMRAVRADRREFLAEGPQAIREALRRGSCLEVFATSAATERHEDLVALADDIEWHIADERVIKAIGDTVHPQGIIARCRFVDVPLAAAMENIDRLVVVCADVRDPGNAGTVIRCADAAGADAVILTGDSVDPFNPKAVRASVGSVFHVPLVVDSDTATVLTSLKERGLRVLAADGQAEVGLFDDAAQLSSPTAWLMGNEAWGLSEHVRAQADAQIAVPIYGQAESLNLSTAAAVCLYASARAQRVPD